MLSVLGVLGVLSVLGVLVPGVLHVEAGAKLNTGNSTCSGTIPIIIGGTLCSADKPVEVGSSSGKDIKSPSGKLLKTRPKGSSTSMLAGCTGAARKPTKLRTKSAVEIALCRGAV